MPMDRKQKVLMVTAFVAVAYLGYQIYGLMKGDMRDPVQTANAAEAHIARVPMTVENLPQRPVKSSTHMSEEQKAYLHMVSQYELAKMKRRLLEEKAAIAAAENRIATLNKQTREIDNNLPSQSMQTEQKPLKLSYIDNQNGRWTATLNREGRYFEVHVGSHLPNGSKIVGINHDGVLLKNGVQKQRVTFDGVKNMSHGIMNLPPHSYTIQLIGSYNKRVIEDFITTHELQDHTYMASVASHGKHWYILTYGNYKTRQEAEAALSALPSPLTAKSPWVRLVSTIQKRA